MPRIVALADRLLRVDQRADRGFEPADLAPARGPQSPPHRLAVRRAGAPHVRGLRPAPAGADAPVLALPMGRHRTVGVGRAQELRQRADDPDLVGVILNAFKLIVFFSLHPGRRSGCIVASVMRRIATGRFGTASRTVALPSAGHPARRGRHRLEMGPVHVRRRQPGPVGDRARRRHAGLAGRLRHRPACRRDHRGLGADRSVHDPAAHRHEQDRPRPLRVGAARRRRCVPGVPVDHASEPSPGDRRLHHGHGHRRARELRHRVHRDRRRTRRRRRRCPGSRSTSSPSPAGRSAWRLRSRWSCSSWCLVCVLPIQRLARGDES